MLENTVWRQYHQDNDYASHLSRCTNIAFEEIIQDEKLLYGIMKSKLTKKELKLFAMDSANIDENIMMEQLSLDAQELEKAKAKLYKKFKQDKTRLSFRA